MEQELLSEIRNHIAFLTLNRPAVLNTLTHGMIKETAGLLEAWAEDADVRAVVVRSAGEKAFCAGGDVRAVYRNFKASNEIPIAFFSDEYRLDYSIYRYPKPYVALMDGIVMGGGMGIAQGASIRIVTDRTRMAMPETAIGLFPDVGASYFLSRLDDALGIYLGLTGKELRAADALACELADLYIDAEGRTQLDDTLETLDWSEDPADDLETVLESLSGQGLADPPLEPYFDAIAEHFSEPSVPAIIASLRGERREKFKEWTQQTLQVLERRSPSLLVVTLAQLLRAKTMSLADCFRMELGMVHEAFLHGDFIEGIRALLVDKDNAPRWNPATLEAVSEQTVQRFFTSPWASERHPLRSLARFDYPDP